MPISLPTSAASPTLKLPTLLGSDPRIRQQVGVVLFSSGTYVLYGLITAVQAVLGVMGWPLALALIAGSLLLNGVFYAVVRSGLVAGGGDPGLGRTQLVVGVLCMYIGYAAAGPAANASLIAMASHVVYSMFSMTPRQVWRLAFGTLAGLGLTMLACHALWPARFDPAVQVSGLMYAAMVVPLIALLAGRVTQMTTRLKTQHAELQAALAKLEELATRDELTRAHNRRHMTALLHQQQALHRRLKQPLGLVLIDIDFFKAVNDQHGHAAGDEVLRHFAEVLRAQLRTVDEVARWGGEEFLLLLPGTDAERAMVALDRVQRHLAEAGPETLPKAAPGASQAGLRVSFSAGITVVAPDEAVEAAIERADQAMYRAKTSGRARSVLA